MQSETGQGSTAVLDTDQKQDVSTENHTNEQGIEAEITENEDESTNPNYVSDTDSQHVDSEQPTGNNQTDVSDSVQSTEEEDPDMPVWAKVLKSALAFEDLTVRGTLSRLQKSIALQYDIPYTKIASYYQTHLRDKNVNLRQLNKQDSDTNKSETSTKNKIKVTDATNSPKKRKPRTPKSEAQDIANMVKGNTSKQQSDSDSKTPATQTDSDTANTTTNNTANNSATEIGGNNVAVATQSTVSPQELENAMARMIRYVGAISPKATEKLQKLVGEFGIFNIGFEMAKVAEDYKETDISLMFVQDLEEKLKASESV